jgi:hypothetical protein
MTITTIANNGRETKYNVLKLSDPSPNNGGVMAYATGPRGGEAAFYMMPTGLVQRMVGGWRRASWTNVDNCTIAG